MALDGQSFIGFIGFVPIEDDTIITVTSYDAAGTEVERAEIGPRGRLQPRPQPRDLRASISSSLRLDGTS